MRSRILGTGHYVPPKVITNKDLEKVMSTTDEWIQQRSGIQERRQVEEGVGTADLGYEAAKNALEAAELKATDLDCILFATLSPDHALFPGCGVILQHKLGISDTTIPAFDIRNQCSGYLYCLQVADAFIRQGLYKRILVVGAEVHSSGIEYADRGRQVTVLFGDGAGATILGPTEEEGRGVLSIHLHSQGEFETALMTEHPSCRRKPWIKPEMLTDGSMYPTMNGRLVFKHAVTRMPEVVNEALAANGLSVENVDHWLFHQANMRINEAVAAQLGAPPNKIYHNIHKYGNLSAGAIPSLLDEVVRSGKINKGDLLCMAAFGSGFTWASALIRW
jgi:3-oxoacyl-[acyl-carrier-protein] synthase III